MRVTVLFYLRKYTLDDDLTQMAVCGYYLEVREVRFDVREKAGEKFYYFRELDKTKKIPRKSLFFLVNTDAPRAVAACLKVSNRQTRLPSVSLIIFLFGLVLP